ncbi:MAG: hypothetical protein ISR54_10720 [Chlorobium phaeobacteroides]|uniref:Uncharacterized protein n=1 Tax=Chlorobium phaeobacteroides (strain BS1) TaxID=331678 RepID=B3EKN9_CHLPB|nr:hypothetical protein [Chlorobium phaeobacteroides]MBL6957267.1 hypothetical protein [Chlorobium phaeobacteroides]
MEFSNSSTRAVARLANESKGSIHYHFGRRKSALRSNGKRGDPTVQRLQHKAGHRAGQEKIIVSGKTHLIRKEESEKP